MKMGVGVAAIAALVATPATSAVLFQTSGELSPTVYESVMVLPQLAPGHFKATVEFDRDVSLSRAWLVSVFSYDIDCGGFMCGGSDGEKYASLQSTSARVAQVVFDLDAAHQSGERYYQDDFLQSSFLVGDREANFTLTIEDITAPIPEPATWGLLVAGFGVLGATLRRLPGRAAKRPSSL